ncbi:MAG: hypothetical protein SOW59_08225 [Corynebacterium sp.]|nr:hypothetical protein [Corynebacterium sp.]
MARNVTHLRIRAKFDGAIWLTPEQWDTYRRCPPVRYVRQTLLSSIASDSQETCGVCLTKAPLSELQVAHRVGFTVGVIDWGLTPDWLNQSDNLMIAHRKVCNSAFELTPSDIARKLVELGIDYNDSPAVRSGLVRIAYDANSDEYSVQYHESE